VPAAPARRWQASSGLLPQRRCRHLLFCEQRVASGNFFLDDEVLLAAGVRHFAQYDVQAGAALQADFSVEALAGMLPADNMTKRPLR